VTEVPARFRPPVRSADFIQEPAAGPDERIDVGVLFVGAGPAGLAGAIRLTQLLDGAPDIKAALGDVPVAVVEKGKYPGAHAVSGAVVNPVAFRKLFPGVADAELPFRGAVTGESLYLLSEKRAIRAPLVPPTMRNHGNFVASLSEIARWLGERAEAAGVMLLSDTAAVKALVKDGAVHGILTGAKGLGRDGAPLANLTGANLTYTNNLERIETIRSDGKIDGADPTIAALTGSIEVRFADTSLLDKATSGDPVALEFAYVISANEKLVIEAHEVYLPKPKRAISGPGGVQASFDWRAANNSSAGRMMTVTLTNDVEVY